ncbi:hypothetical protein B7R22_08975 [Subtercola boreus]|uniref:SMP-30/Gluconolactonase/LRE-like region domain-containing protein n=1 Tax=Subtercola boreus TaxID=120213 RepID=A0A3E0VXL4_9MICO|nr:hypothetical protein [Subtercola boreus]RFA14834.1 hypothetical protein B7R22_08975 [Subtercola boreus]
MQALLATSDGSVWVASHRPSSLHRISPGDGTLVTYPLAADISPSALVESRGSIFAATTQSGTMTRVGPDGGLTEVFVQLPLGAEPIALSAGTDGTLYSADWQTGAILQIAADGSAGHGGETTTQECARLPLRTMPVAMTDEHQGAVFIAAGSGLFRLETGDGALAEILNYP